MLHIIGNILIFCLIIEWVYIIVMLIFWLYYKQKSKRNTFFVYYGLVKGKYKNLVIAYNGSYSLPFQVCENIPIRGYAFSRVYDILRDTI